MESFVLVLTQTAPLLSRICGCPPRYIKTGGTEKCFSGGGGHASGSQIELRQVSGLWWVCCGWNKGRGCSAVHACGFCSQESSSTAWSPSGPNTRRRPNTYRYILCCAVGACLLLVGSYNLRKSPQAMEKLRAIGSAASSFRRRARSAQVAAEPVAAGGGDGGWVSGGGGARSPLASPAAGPAPRVHPPALRTSLGGFVGGSRLAVATPSGAHVLPIGDSDSQPATPSSLRPSADGSGGLLGQWSEGADGGAPQQRRRLSLTGAADPQQHLRARPELHQSAGDGSSDLSPASAPATAGGQPQLPGDVLMLTPTSSSAGSPPQRSSD